jgi:hypothetical protein
VCGCVGVWVMYFSGYAGKGLVLAQPPCPGADTSATTLCPAAAAAAAGAAPSRPAASLVAARAATPSSSTLTPQPSALVAALQPAPRLQASPALPAAWAAAAEVLPLPLPLLLLRSRAVSPCSSRQQRPVRRQQGRGREVLVSLLQPQQALRSSPSRVLVVPQVEELTYRQCGKSSQQAWRFRPCVRQLHSQAGYIAGRQCCLDVQPVGCAEALNAPGEGSRCLTTAGGMYMYTLNQELELLDSHGHDSELGHPAPCSGHWHGGLFWKSNPANKRLDICAVNGVHEYT